MWLLHGALPLAKHLVGTRWYMNPTLSSPHPLRGS